MKPRLKCWLGIGLLGLGLATGAQAQRLNTSVSLWLSHEEVAPGDSFVAGIQMKMADPWHTYWVNPGASGQATRATWTLPDGLSAGELRWPVPEVFDTAGFITYGYHHETVLMAGIDVASDLAPGTYPVELRLNWLECETDGLCVPGSALATGSIRVGSSRTLNPQAQDVLQEWTPYLPTETSATATVAWGDGADPTSRSVSITISGVDPNWEQVGFIPGFAEDYAIEVSEAVSMDDGTLEVSGQALLFAGEWPESLGGVLAYTLPGEERARGQEIVAQVGAPESGGAATEGRGPSVLFMILMGLLGGIILNFMPCVLPVISLKVTSLIKMGGGDGRSASRQGLFYFIGVLASFLVMAGIVIGLKETGRVVGWGGQFGNLYFVVLMSAVITVLAMNLFGVFEFQLGSGAMKAAGDASTRSGALGAFMSGALATTLATACTAPILSLAATFALTQSHLVTVVVFLSMGVGLGFPFYLLAARPELRRFLPKPGAWMERFKTIMGFLVLGTALWALSLIQSHRPEDGVLWLGIFLVHLSMACWVWGAFVQRSLAENKAAPKWIAVAIAVGGAWMSLEWGMDWRGVRQGIDWREWSPEAIAEAQAKGRPVFVDFTASWCVNCDVNKRTSVEIPEVIEVLRKKGFVTLKGDYSATPEHMTKELLRFGRPGVPLNLVYSASKDGEPIVLPELLTPRIVLEGLENAAPGGSPLSL